MKQFLPLVFVLLVVFTSCEVNTTNIVIDVNAREEEDIKKINAYIDYKKYDKSKVGVTENGVRYIILDSGNVRISQQRVDENDIISIDYVAKHTTDTIIGSSIESRVLGKTVHNKNRKYVPLVITYSKTGWTMQSDYMKGFREGLSATFNKVGVGCHVLILFSSRLASTTSVFNIRTEEIVIFDLYLVKVRKQ